MIQLRDLRFDYGKTFAQNLFARLFDIAIPHLKSYHSDLGHDAITLSKADAGDLYLWGWRELGTHMIHVYRPGANDLPRGSNKEGLDTAGKLIRMGGTIPPDHWHVIYISKVHTNGVTTEGHVCRLLDGYDGGQPEAAKIDEALARIKLFAAMADKLATSENA